MSSLWILCALAFVLAWVGVCWLVNLRTRPSGAPEVTDPGREAITEFYAAAPRLRAVPGPTGLHRKTTNEEGDQ